MMQTLLLGCCWLSFISFLSFSPIHIVHIVAVAGFPLHKKKVYPTSSEFCKNGSEHGYELQNPTRANGLGGKLGSLLHSKQHCLLFTEVPWFSHLTFVYIEILVLISYYWLCFFLSLNKQRNGEHSQLFYDYGYKKVIVIYS